MPVAFVQLGPKQSRESEAITLFCSSREGKKSHRLFGVWGSRVPKAVPEVSCKRRPGVQELGQVAAGLGAEQHKAAGPGPHTRAGLLCRLEQQVG